MTRVKVLTTVLSFLFSFSFLFSHQHRLFSSPSSYFLSPPFLLHIRIHVIIHSLLFFTPHDFSFHRQMNNNNHFNARGEDLLTRASSPTESSSRRHHPMHMQEGVRATETMKTTEWTDEKHSMYLKSIEASFVNQLYDSKHIPRKPPSNHNPPSTSGQFKVLQRGCWQKINFERENPHLIRNNNNNNHHQCHDLTSNPWIQHYRCQSKQRGAVPSLQESVTSTNKVVDLIHQRKNHGDSSVIPRQQHLHLSHHICHEDMLSSDTEVSDQNFVDEQVEEEKESKRNKVKRQRASTIDEKGNDQMVPNKSSSTGGGAKNWFHAT
ncbi:uncharacterized protein [Arachis hypogaea]|uniref:Cold-regulated protein n=3 Tax=Arachis hypogaea TaxID=3818 RepID=A0A444YWF1_ARAHY|nr:uncharacterized protein DS421_16g563830 [Arachis hypogaea]RYR06259.1 hypothetical protein Ahy_B06g086018 isoform B [Arachis hypogaea]